MSETDTKEPTAKTAKSSKAKATDIQPVEFSINGQYIKDFSFENPNAPQSFQQDDSQPDININVDVTARQIGDDAYESVLQLQAKATRGTNVLFVVELEYAGVFTIRNVPQEQISGALLVECPRLLFPFARQIVADATQQGGFIPLLLQPIDFSALFRQQQEQANQQTSQQSNQANGAAKPTRSKAS